MLVVSLEPLLNLPLKHPQILTAISWFRNLETYLEERLANKLLLAC
jgi:hypothetical protein